MRHRLRTVWRRAVLVGAAFAAVALTAAADESAIRRNLPQRLPDLPAIDAVRQSEMPGLWEVRMGAEVVYTDGAAAFVLEGDLIDARRRVNLTEEREQALKAFDFRKLPLADAVTWKRGTGRRQLVVFADPNCSFCRALEQKLAGVTNVTVHTFLIPILGDDSVVKARAIWCAPPKQRGEVWRHWMVDGVAPPAVPATARCDTAALTRNLALQHRHGVTGTPTLVFADNARAVGIVEPADLEKKFATLVARTR